MIVLCSVQLTSSDKQYFCHKFQLGMISVLTHYFRKQGKQTQMTLRLCESE